MNTKTTAEVIKWASDMARYVHGEQPDDDCSWNNGLTQDLAGFLGVKKVPASTLQIARDTYTDVLNTLS